MGLKRRLKEAAKPVKIDKQALTEGATHVNSGSKLPTSTVIQVTEATELEQNGIDYIPIEVAGSNGKKYKIVIPRAYYKSVPKQWHWDELRYKAADLMAAGYPIKHIAEFVGYSRMTLYGWLQHPEFKEHVDGLIMETGWANQRERVAGLNKVTELLFDKVVNELKNVKLTDKSIGPILTAIQSIAKQISQEKGEFIEQSRVDQATTVSGVLGVTAVPAELLLKSKAAEERKALEEEFNAIGDDIIRSITGEKE